MGLPVALCDVCKSPGACCRNFPLSIVFWDDESIEDQWAAAKRRFEPSNGEMPFVPVRKCEGSTWRDPDSGRMYSEWRFRCNALQPNGRCGVYADRPYPCRAFLPGSNSLCAMYLGPDARPIDSLAEPGAPPR